MMKYIYLFACTLAVASAYAVRPAYGGVPVGAIAYQVQPAVTVQHLVPAGNYGSNYGSNYAQRNNYAAEIPIASYPSNVGHGYGSAAPVDRDAIALARLALAAPSAGAPLILPEPRPYVQPIYAPNYNVAPVYSQPEAAKGGSAAAASSSVAGDKGYDNRAAY